MKVLGLLSLVLVGAASKDATDGTELVFSFLVHRHGARTPVPASLSYSNNETALRELSAPYGFGQLTNLGKQKGYDLGKYIRSRYSELLSPQYNRSEVYLRSTDSTRAKMTLLAALAAVFPPEEDDWSQDLKWTPVPYTTVPPKYDFNTAFVNCPTFIDGYTSLSDTQPSSFKKDKKLLTLLSDYVSTDLVERPVLVYSVYDVFVSQMSLGLPLAPEIQKEFKNIEELAAKAIDVLFGDEDYIPLQAGVLLNEFFTKADSVIAGEDTQRLRIYSAHDFNVFSFESVTKISNKQGVPKYASAYSLEVRRDLKTGKYVVLPVYLPEPGSPVKYLKIKDCSQPCDLEKFRKITAPFVLDEDTWRTKCGFDKDMVVDDSAIN